MTKQAKYGWAIGLIIAGVAGALPFRNTSHSVSSNPAGSETPSVAQRQNSESPKQPAKNGGDEAGNDVRAKKTLTNSSLLPDSDGNAEGSELNANENPPRVIVGQIPNRLNKSRLPLANSQNIVDRDGNGTDNPALDQSSILRKETEQAVVPRSQNPVASLPPTDNQNSIRQMPRDVGPYRMRPVHSSNFRQSSRPDRQDSVINDTVINASRKRQVVRYKLRDGDTLRTIAKRYLGDANRFEEILSDNRHVLTNGESYLPVGEYITIVIQ